jgi:hypothetical protein
MKEQRRILGGEKGPYEGSEAAVNRRGPGEALQRASNREHVITK